jgi:hypothetical protein
MNCDEAGRYGIATSSRTPIPAAKYLIFGLHPSGWAAYVALRLPTCALFRTEIPQRGESLWRTLARIFGAEMNEGLSVFLILNFHWIFSMLVRLVIVRFKICTIKSCPILICTIINRTILSVRFLASDYKMYDFKLYDFKLYDFKRPILSCTI